LGGQVAMRPSVLQKTATGELITWGSRIRILSSLPAETRPEGFALAVVMLAAAALRDLGGVPDVVTPALGRANHPDAAILVSFPGIGPVLVEQPARANQLDSLFFGLHEQLLSKLPLIHFDRHRSECFGHHQGTVNLSNPRAIFAGPRP
jgi:hypothetical protein